MGNITCPHCDGIAAVPDPSSLIGIRRFDAVGSIRIVAPEKAFYVICCCHCGEDFYYDPNEKEQAKK